MCDNILHWPCVLRVHHACVMWALIVSDFVVGKPTDSYLSQRQTAEETETETHTHTHTHTQLEREREIDNGRDRDDVIGRVKER